MAKYNPNLPSESFDKADYEALRNSNIPSGLVNTAHFDSADNASVFFARELDYIKSKSYDKQYPEFTALKIFPVSNEVPEGAETITYYSYEKTGFAKIISNYATDLPRADVKGEPTTSPIKGIGASYGYSMQEMRASRMAGKSLDVRKAESAHYQVDRLINKVAWAGDADNKLVGILSTGNNIPVYTLSTVTATISGSSTTTTLWQYKTGDEIVDDIKGMIKQMTANTMAVERADTIAMPPSIYDELSLRRMGTYDSLSVLEYIRKCLPDFTFERCPELEATATETNPYAASSKAVIVMFKNDPEKFTIEVPMQFYQYPLQPKGLEIEVPCEARVAGAVIYYPMSLMIAAGV